VSGVWVRARKLEGEADVGGRRILRSHRGIHSSHCGTSLVLAKQPESGLPMRRRTGETLHRGRVVSLLFDIVPETGWKAVLRPSAPTKAGADLKPSFQSVSAFALVV